MKPRIFIGSSKEHLDLARAVQENLDQDAETKIWDQDVFHLSQYPLDALKAELQQSDFGIFILSPADPSVIRGKRYTVPRDNVVFELGLFVGHLEYNRTFIITPRGVNNLHLPSDLHGLTVGDYDPNRTDGNMTAAVSAACNKIRKLILERFPVVSKQRVNLIHAGLFSDFGEEFENLIRKSTEIVLYFIHSRRWRENNNDYLQEFLQKPEAKLAVFLPDLGNAPLIRVLMGHFDDGPHIPGFIADAYRYFLDLSKHYTGKVRIRLFNIYPTYTFYKFNETFIVAMYPTTAIRKSVPAFEIAADGTFGEFLAHDIEQLLKECREPSKDDLLRLQNTVSSFSVREEIDSKPKGKH